MQDFVKASKERQAKFEAGILAKLSEIVPTTPQYDKGSCNLKTNHLVIPEFVSAYIGMLNINPQQHSKNLQKRYLFFH